MTEYRGFVKKINTKSGSGKRGPWTAYSLRLEGDDGVEINEWLSYGFEAPKFKEGDYIKLEAAKDEKGYLKINPATVKVAKNPPARAGSGGGGSRDEGVPNVGRGGGVDYNSAVARAIELTDLLIKHDALTLSAAKGAGGIEKRRAEIVAVVDKYTVKLYNDIKTVRLLETVQDEGAVDTTPDGELPEGDDQQEKEDGDEFE